MAYETITASIEYGIGRLTLDQPDKLNPLGTNTLQDIIDATTWFNKENVSVVIVSGNGRAFTAGFDLREFTNTDSTGKDGAVLGREIAEAVDRMKPVTIASLHGHCIGGGVVLASACDLRIASENTIFSIPEVDLGIPLAWGGIPRLVREIGPAMTKELVMTCRAYGLRAIDGPFGDFNDPDAYIAAAKRGAAIGIEGKWAIHPSQIELANKVFSPPSSEVTKAKRILEELDKAAKAGKGAAQLDGRMIDAASARMAENIVNIDKQINRK